MPKIDYLSKIPLDVENTKVKGLLLIKPKLLSFNYFLKLSFHIFPPPPLPHTAQSTIIKEAAKRFLVKRNLNRQQHYHIHHCESLTLRLFLLPQLIFFLTSTAAYFFLHCAWRRRKLPMKCNYIGGRPKGMETTSVYGNVQDGVG
jgi:hypothetical protein